MKRWPALRKSLVEGRITFGPGAAAIIALAGIALTILVALSNL